jgi:hypothetical protein
MTIEQEIYSLLSPLVNKRVYPDTPPEVFDIPFIVYQQVGGNAVQYVDNTLPDKRHSRIQISVWADTRNEANTIAHKVEEMLVGAGINCEIYGGLTAVYDSVVRIYGTRQDFGFWF